MRRMSKRQAICLILVPGLLIGIGGCHPFAEGLGDVTHTPTPMNSATAAPTFTPDSAPIPTFTVTPFPTRVPSATPEVLANGSYQWRLSSVGLTLSCPPEIVRSWYVDERDIRQQAISLDFTLRAASFVVVAYPRRGYSLEAVARSPKLVWDLDYPATPPPTPNAALRMNEFLIDGNPALRLILDDRDLRVGAVWFEHGDSLFYAVGWGGELHGDLLYSPSERRQIRAWFDQIIATLKFSD